jgi:hypothetical protein
MSFILDQLKKAGKQRALEMAMRRQTEQPGEKTAEPLLVRSSDRTPVSVKKWQIAAVAILLGPVAVYGVVSFLRGTSLMRQPVVPAATGLVQKASPLPAAPLSVPSVQIPRARVQEERASGVSPAAEQKKTEAAKAVKHVAAPDMGRNAPEQAGPDRSTEERGKRSRVVLMDTPVGFEPSGSVREFKQLPQAVRKSLPEIRITSHLFRKDSRLVSINGRIMSEGFNMEDGLFLEEITPEGVILSFRSHRFSVRAD